MFKVQNPQQKIASLILSGSFLLLFLTVAYAVWQWRADYKLAHEINTLPQTLPTTNTNNALLVELPEQHLLGKALTKLGDVPITNLQLKVAGITKVLDSDPEKASRVYISIEGAPSKLFKLGDSLPYGVKIYSISADAVILENEGRLEKLPLPRKKLVFKNRPNKEEG